MVHELQRRRLLFFVSEQQRSDFISRQKQASGPGSLSFKNFFKVYEQFDLRASATALQRAREDMPPLQYNFCEADEDVDMELSRTELLALLGKHVPPGALPPDDAAMTTLVGAQHESGSSTGPEHHCCFIGAAAAAPLGAIATADGTGRKKRGKEGRWKTFRTGCRRRCAAPGPPAESENKPHSAVLHG